MIKSILFALLLIMPTAASMAQDDTDTIIPVEQLLTRDADDTQCATAVFATALAATLANVPADAPETTIQGIIQNTFTTQTVLTQVLACPEIANADDDTTIKFQPIEYTFPGGRKVTVNYETQPRVLKQHLLLATKKSLPEPEVSPRIGNLDDPTIWTNTDPAWYGILVVQSGALDDFVGNGKNNTISLQYIEEKIDTLYPTGWSCTSKSALANDNDNLNKSMHNTVGLEAAGESDPNDYYVAGDVNLQWISYTEIAVDLVITVLTFGGSAVILGITKAARASRALRSLSATIRTLLKSEKVIAYVKLLQRAKSVQKELDAIRALNQIDKIKDTIKTLDAAKDAKKIAQYEKEIEQLNKIATAVKNVDKAKDTTILEKEIAEANKTLRQMEATEKEVKEYNQATKSFNDLKKYINPLRKKNLFRIPNRGNIAARVWQGTKNGFKALKAANTGGKTIGAAARIGRTGTKSARIKDWLFHQTAKNIGKLAKFQESTGLLYGTIKFVGDMYDYTETSTGEFTNDIQFKPLLLLSADDLPGQENKVNYGMWLMWLGNSVDASDDDAAYLQAMDFANKFTLDLNQYQQDINDYSCELDVYVVRPIIREPDSDNPQLYYLIMNDIPWRVTHH